VDEPLRRFDALLDVVRREIPEAWETLLVDLGEVRGFDYYTGMRLRVWARGVSAPIGGGGRYDDLLGRYGEPRPATGFAFDLDAVEATLVQQGALPADTRPRAAVVVVPHSDDATLRDAATEAARQERAAGRRAWIWTGLTVPRALELAAERGVERVLEVGAGGTVTRTHTVPRQAGTSP
jgi:ATP phosphoribosyltransferase regulatory subunit